MKVWGPELHVGVGGRTVIFDLEIHMAEGVPMKSLSIGKAQNSLDHQKRLTWTGVMIVSRVSFFSDTRVKSAGRS